MRSISASQSPVDPYDGDRDRERGREHERASHSRRRARYQDSPSRSPPAPLSARPQHGQGAPTALPSIHHLHPDLPPPHAHAHAHAHPRHAGPAVQQYSPSEFLPGASYGHGTSAFFAGTSSHIQQRSPMSASALPASYPPSAHDGRRVPFERPLPPGIRPPQSSSSAYPEPRASPPDLESDQEQNESERGPPKKKRRRQALSCTGKQLIFGSFLVSLLSIPVPFSGPLSNPIIRSCLPSSIMTRSLVPCLFRHAFSSELVIFLQLLFMVFHIDSIFSWLIYIPSKLQNASDARSSVIVLIHVDPVLGAANRRNVNGTSLNPCKI